MTESDKKHVLIIVAIILAIIAVISYFSLTSNKSEMKITTTDFFMQQGTPDSYGKGKAEREGKLENGELIDGEGEGDEDSEGDDETTAKVYVTSKGFLPKSISIFVGEKIKFINRSDEVIQLYTKSDRIEIVRKIQQPDETRTITFDKSGAARVVNVFNRKNKMTLTVNRH